MSLFIIVLGIILTFFSVAILSYVSIATMMGPWIAPTLVLLSSMALRIRSFWKYKPENCEDILFIQAIGAGGGVIAVGVGFTLPILFFLDADLFNAVVLQHPLIFCIKLGVICLVAGGLGIVWGRYFSSKLIHDDQLPFPTCQMTYYLAALPSKSRHIRQLFFGGVATFIISFLRDGLGRFSGILPKNFIFFNGQLAFPVWPTMWVIGFTSGYAIALPLLIGLVTQKMLHFLCSPHSYFLTHGFISSIPIQSFITAFCAGLIVSEMVVWGYKKVLLLIRKQCYVGGLSDLVKRYLFTTRRHVQQQRMEAWVALILAGGLFYLAELQVATQLIYVCLLFFATYEISFLGGEIGLVPFGRFSTLLLIPLLLMFKLSYLQITFICVFFSICAASASDLIFDYKTASLANLDTKKIYYAQWIGLIAAAVSIGFVLYLLFTHLSLGSPEFFGQRGQSKALMVKTFDFNLYIVGVGLLYGIMLKKCGITPLMTFGGIIMPTNITTGLLAGALFSRLVRQDRYIAVCSGVLVSEVCWIILSIVTKLFS